MSRYPHMWHKAGQPRDKLARPHALLGALQPDGVAQDGVFGGQSPGKPVA